VPGIVVRVVGDGGEEGDDRKAELVAEMDGQIESRIVEGTLSALHPVDDALAAFERAAGAAHCDPGIGIEGGERWDWSRAVLGHKSDAEVTAVNRQASNGKMEGMKDGLPGTNLALSLTEEEGDRGPEHAAGGGKDHLEGFFNLVPFMNRGVVDI
jgi:hypothetical protein